MFLEVLGKTLSQTILLVSLPTEYGKSLSQKKKKEEVWKESNSLANNYEFDDHWSTSKL